MLAQPRLVADQGRVGQQDRARRGRLVGEHRGTCALQRLGQAAGIGRGCRHMAEHGAEPIRGTAQRDHRRGVLMAAEQWRADLGRRTRGREPDLAGADQGRAHQGGRAGHAPQLGQLGLVRRRGRRDAETA